MKRLVLALGSGGVSLFALQFAKLFGAQVIATTSSEQKAQVLREIGADHVIEIGGAGTLEQSLKSAAVEAQICLIGWLANAAPFDYDALNAGVYTLRRVALGNRAHFEAMNRAVAMHEMKPLIDRVFAFDDARTAFEYFLERDAVGKVSSPTRERGRSRAASATNTRVSIAGSPPAISALKPRRLPASGRTRRRRESFSCSPSRR